MPEYIQANQWEKIMSLLGKAKDITAKVAEKAVEFSSDELIADTIIKAVEKQEKVNEVLEKKGSSYRINDIDLQMGIPPTVVFGIRRVETDIQKTLEDKK